MRRLFTTLAALLVSGFIVLSNPGSACACDCAEITDDEAFENADTVFSATLTRIDDGLLGDAQNVLLEFEVDQVYKGEAAASQGVLTPNNGASCGWLPPEDEKYMVYASREDGEVWTYLCGGSRALDQDPSWLASAVATEPTAGEAGIPGPGLWPYVVAGTALLAALAVVLFLRRRFPKQT